jgi:hypothetical protein
MEAGQAAGCIPFPLSIPGPCSRPGGRGGWLASLRGISIHLSVPRPGEGNRGEDWNIDFGLPACVRESLGS